MIKHEAQISVAPSLWEAKLAELVLAVAQIRGVPAPSALSGLSVSADAADLAVKIAAGVNDGPVNVAILIGNSVVQHPSYARLAALIETLAGLLGGRFGYLTESANTVGAYIVGAVPRHGGLNAAQMLSSSSPLKALVLLNTEPDLDSANGAQAAQTLKDAPFVVSLSSFKSNVSEYANVILPITPFTETSGTYVSAEGRVQSFQATVKPLGQARPAWKVLRVLGNLLNLSGFDANSSEDINKSALPSDVRSVLINDVGVTVQAPLQVGGGLERIANVPIYFTDALVRRAPSLQKTKDSTTPAAHVHTETAVKLKLSQAKTVRVASVGYAGGVLNLVIDNSVAPGAVKIAAGHASTVAIGPMFGPIELSAVNE